MLQCNSYEVERDGKLLATLLTGQYHSGDRYFVFKMNERQYVIKNDASFLKDEYRVINRGTNEQVGKFLFGAQWFGKTAGTLITDQTYTFKQQAASQLLKPSTWKACKFQLFSQDVNIEYNGQYQQSAFNGTIDINVSGKYLEAVLGLFIIDERHRINEERVP